MNDKINNFRENYSNWFGQIQLVLLSLFFVAFVVCYFGIFFSNPKTPAGYVGYVTRGAMVGKSEFVKVQYGPTSSGAGWLLRVLNVPATPRTFEEDFSGSEGIVSGDNTMISFAVNVTLRLRHDPEGNKHWTQDYIEHYSTLHSGETPEQLFLNTYANNVKPRIRYFVRLATQTHNGLDIQDNMQKIADEVMAKIQEETAGKPFEILSITVGRIHYPDIVTNQVANSLIAAQHIEQQTAQVELTKRDARMMVIDNEGMAEAADIINRSISAPWLQYQALVAEQKNVKSNSATSLMIPVGAMGVPTIDGLTKLKP
jgi:hypothetical protein